MKTYLPQSFSFLVLICLSLDFGTACSNYNVNYLNVQLFTSYSLSSPGYPYMYSDYSRCKWRITAPYGYHVQLDFKYFNTSVFYSSSTALCSSSSTDNLKVYDSSYATSSKLIGKYCGSYLPATVISSDRYLYLQFYSYNNFQRRKGFSLVYKAVKAPYGVSSTCSPFNTASINSNIKLNHTSMYIKSPFYPQKYPSNIKCVWYITVSPSSNRINLTVLDSNLQTYNSYSTCSSSSSTQDRLTIRDGAYTSSKILKTICRKLSSPPLSLISSGRYMTVQFNSNEDNYFSNGAAGFMLKYSELSSSDVSACSPSNSFSVNNNIRVMASSSAKYIKSPWYPNNYPNNIQCTWYITASSSSNKIQLTLSDVKIYNTRSYSCSSYSSQIDMLTIRDGLSTYSKELKTVCNRLYTVTTVTSTGRYMTIKFKTNSDNYFPSQTAGFKLQYQELEPDSNVGMIVGIVIGVAVAIFLLVFCMWKSNARTTQRTPAATTLQPTRLTTTHPQPSAQPSAPRYPLPVQCEPIPGQESYQQPQGSYRPPLQGNYPAPPPHGNYPSTQLQGSYQPPLPSTFLPSSQGSYRPLGGYQPYPASNYPPPVEDPLPNEPPPQYPGLPTEGYIQSTPPYNPQFPMTSQSNPAYNPQFPHPSQSNSPYPAGNDNPAFSGSDGVPKA